MPKPSGGKDPPSTSHELDAALKPSLALIWEETKKRAKSKPAVAPPDPLKAFIGHRNPPKNLREVIDGDSDYRAAMLDCGVITEAEAGEIAWNWLTRPTGWGTIQKRLLKDAASAQQLREAESRLNKAQAKVDSRTKAVDKAEKEFDRSKGTERDKQRAANDARAALSAADAKLQEAQESQAEAEAAFKRAQKLLEKAQNNKKDKQNKLNKAKSELNRAKKDLGSAEEALKPASPTKKPPRPKQTQPAKPQRPIQLPEGVKSGTPEASQHLFGQSHATVLIDGYNVAFLKWPPPNGKEPKSNELPNVRARLERRCRRFAAQRIALDVVLVWDGQPNHRRVRSDSRAGGLEVIFSRNPQKADDVIVEKCASLNGQRCPVVVTNDKELQRRARATGANVVSSDVFWDGWLQPPTPARPPTRG